MSDLPPIPTMEEARASVEAEWEAEREQALNYEAKRIIANVKAIHRRPERERKAQEQRERQAAEHAKDATKAWRKVFGRKIAGQLDPWTLYEVLTVEDTAFVCTADKMRDTWTRRS